MQTRRGTAAKGPYPGEALALPQGGVVTGLADSGGGRLALEGRGGLQGAGGLPGVADFGELYAAALQNGFIQPGTMRDWRAEVEASALYWEYLRNFYGAQPAVPLLPEWSGGGWEGPVEIEGSALVPMFQDAVPSVQSGIELITPVENPVESDIIKSNGEKEKAANYTSIERTWRLGQTSRDQVQKTLEDFASSFSRSEKEHGITITKEGEVFLLTGTSVTIDHSVIGAESLRGSVGVHNHPVPPGETMGDSFSRADLIFSAKYGTGIEFLVSGSRRNAFQFLREYTEDEIYYAWEAALRTVRERAYFNKTPIIWEQEEVMKILAEQLEGFKFYENF